MITAIIGGGAAGLMAACLLVRRSAQVVLLEKQPRVGRKLLSTGNGRCNLTNLNASPRDYHGDARYVRAALAALPPAAAIDLFESLGVLCAPDAEGRVYPVSNQAAGVLDGLRLYLAEHGCDVQTECAAARVDRRKDGFSIECADGRRVRADYVLIACGGLAAPKLGACADGYRLLEGFGHTITPRHPAIAALKTDPAAVRALKGIRMHGEISLHGKNGAIRTEAGEILFGDGTISGIAAMQLARDVNLRAKEELRAHLNFLPNTKPDLILERAALLPDRLMDDFLTGIVPKRLGQAIVKAAGVQLSAEAGSMRRSEAMAVQARLTDFTLPVTGTLGYDQAQVTSGGARITEFSEGALESMRCPNLFAAGEVLDVDGDCGGFNLQWAWASAKLVTDEILKRCGL